MDLKGHIKRHSAIISDKAALVEGSDRIAGKENKRPLQDNGAEIENEKTEKKARLERTGGDNLLGGWQDDCVLLTRQPGEQLLPRNENSLDHDDDVVVTGVSGLWASELPHSRDQCAKFPFLKKTSTDNKNCCKQCYCFVCDRPQLECIKWGSGTQASDHCNAYDSWEWLLRRAGSRRSTGVEVSDDDDDEDLDEGYIPLGTVCIPVAAKGKYNLVNLPPTHSENAMDLFQHEWSEKRGAFQPKKELVYLRLDTGEQDLPREERPKEKELEGVLDEIRSLAPLDYLDDDAELHVTLIVCPSETSALFGVVRIKLSLQRSAFGWGQKVKLGKVLAYMCKDTDPVLQERVKELSRLKTSKSVNKIKSFAALLKKVQSDSVSDEEQPEGLAEAVTLRPYQNQSLRFMLDSERRESGFHGLIWHKISGAGTPREDVFFCPILQTIKLEKKEKLVPVTTGGFLCEEMGLGKTVEILALTVANPHPHPPMLPAGPPLSRGRRLPPIPDGGVTSKATLVVCAVSLVGQWISEAESKLKGPISIYKYHGSNRHTDPFFLAGHDIVITTYGILGKDYGALTGQVVESMFDGKPLSEEDKARLSPLHSIKWWRVVLDESHTVKDPTVQQSRACAALKADRRWCCSGTPINTSISDLHGQFVFLGLDPFDDRQTFVDEIGRPFERSFLTNDVYDKSKSLLVFLLRKVMVRHTKTQTIDGEKLLVLPPKTQVDMPIHLSPEERTFYDSAAAEAKERFSSFRLLGPEYIGKHMLKIMALLLPLRRICSGGEIVLPSSSNGKIPEDDEDLSIAGLDTAPVPFADLPPDAECSICLEVMERPAKTPCNHWFCHECLTGALDSGPSQNRCPLCRQEMTVGDVIEGELPDTSTAVGPYLGADEGEGGPVGAPEDAPFLVKSKLKALLEDLQKLRESDPTAKALIFSQFMGTIDWLKTRLTAAGVKYRYISGDMPLKKRAQAIEQFQQDPPTTVFLLSIRTGAVGITLTSASVVYLLEPVLNPALEDQAVGRAWRMGQQRPVTVKRMFVADSVEEKILKVVKNRVEGGAAKPASFADRELAAAYKSKGKTARPETIAGSIRFDKQNLRMSEFELLFS